MTIEDYCIKYDSRLTDALQIIDQNRGSVLFVVDEKGRLIGAISDGDIRRWIIRNGELSATVESAMNANPKYLLEEDMAEAQLLMENEDIKAVPILDRRNVILSIIFRDRKSEIKKDKTELKDVPVVIMAGGKGTRLYPYTKILPKPLIPIGEIPIVERVINEFVDFGAKDFLMTVNYKKNMIQSYFSENDTTYNIEFIEERQPLGTAGSLSLIPRNIGDTIIVANSDSLIKTDYEELYRNHIELKNDITIVAAVKHDIIPYGVIKSDNKGEFESMEEKPTRSYLINTGMYVINANMIDLVPDNKMFHMTDLINCAKGCNCKIGVYPIGEDAFLDMGEFAEMKRMEEKLNLG